MQHFKIPKGFCDDINSKSATIKHLYLKAGLGICLHGSRGELVCVATALTIGMAEALAIRFGLQEAKRMNVTSLVVKSDALLVISKISSHGTNCRDPPLSGLLLDIDLLL
uniref:RNase H type-1 domain-containing protein n=1 Tax=Nelumbo nucifera TaxID=4432 RepID=A0A822YY48_NELNU|nr:TPA_asm: hypothetical protein HUJ06_006859 [Nelumbo nucifera]